MTDLHAIVAELKRPRLLIRAARAGLADYNRARDLKRLMRTAEAPGPERAVSALLAEEQRLEETRRNGDAAYSFARHIDVLIAVLAETRLLSRPGAQA
jgi:hypothetical protein